MSASAPNAAWERAPVSDPVPGAMYRRQATWRSRLIATSKDHSILPLSMAPPILPLALAPSIFPPVVSFEEQPGTAQAVMSNEAMRVVSRRNERIGELL